MTIKSDSEELSLICYDKHCQLKVGDMGQEISTFLFKPEDYTLFEKKLHQETKLLKQLFDTKSFSNDHGVGGFELEAWLIDSEYNPAPINTLFLEKLNDPLVEDELARFNIEINTPPFLLNGKALSKMHDYLKLSWQKCIDTAKTMDAGVMITGILPTVRNKDLIPDNLSQKIRYRALNDQIMLYRKGNPISIDIKGKDRLTINRYDVMLEAATTSFQIQFQVDSNHSVRFYNSALIISSPMVSATANSPFIFGKDLWDESRIPLFEQSISLHTGVKDSFDRLKRVTFGNGYIKNTLFELFDENIKLYKILLPKIFDEKPESFSHFRLHNGTIWRWNRPLIGFDEMNNPHLRIEHRSVASGPSLIDTIANAALFFGLIEEISKSKTPYENRISFEDSQRNFYESAQYGLSANIIWTAGKKVSVKNLLLEELLPMAKKGCKRLGIHQDDIDFYLDIVKNRLESGQNGAVWQRKYKEKHNCDMKTLCQAYFERQESKLPVHEWAL